MANPTVSTEMLPEKNLAFSPTNVTIWFMMEYTDEDGNTHYNPIRIGAATHLGVTVTRQKIPIYTLGQIDAADVGRGVRSVEGYFRNIAIDTGLLIKLYQETIKDGNGVPKQIYKNNFAASDANSKLFSVHEDFREALVRTIGSEDNIPAISEDNKTFGGETFQNMVKILIPAFLDELAPLNIVAVGINEEDGDAYYAEIYGAEFMDAAWSITQNNVAVTENLTFVATHFKVEQATM